MPIHHDFPPHRRITLPGQLQSYVQNEIRAGRTTEWSVLGLCQNPPQLTGPRTTHSASGDGAGKCHWNGGGGLQGHLPSTPGPRSLPPLRRAAFMGGPPQALVVLMAGDYPGTGAIYPQGGCLTAHKLGQKTAAALAVAVAHIHGAHTTHSHAPASHPRPQQKGCGIGAFHGNRSKAVVGRQL